MIPIDAKTRGDDGGFLAVDALVALLVTAMGLAIVMQAQGLSTRMLGAARDMRTATARAQLCLDLWQASKPDGVTADAGGGSVETRTSSPAASVDPVAPCKVQCIATMRPSGVAVRLTTQRLCPVKRPT